MDVARFRFGSLQHFHDWPGIVLASAVCRIARRAEYQSGKVNVGAEVKDTEACCDSAAGSCQHASITSRERRIGHYGRLQFKDDQMIFKTPKVSRNIREPGNQMRLKHFGMTIGCESFIIPFFLNSAPSSAERRVPGKHEGFE